MTELARADPVLVSDGQGLSDASSRASLSVGRTLGFSLGMIGDRIFRDAPALLLLIYMTNYLAIPPALAGVAIFIPKIVIIFVDPMVGTLSDRLTTPWGRRRPLMFLGALLASISLLMFFHVPRFAGPVLQATYMSGIVLLGFMGYSLYSVPYLTMASELAGDDDERRRIMSYRVVFMAIGLAVSAFAGGVVQMLGGGIGGYETMSYVYAGICLVTMMTTVFATGRIAVSRGDAERLTIPAQVRMVAANRAYLSLTLVSFAQKTAEGVGYGSFAFFCIYVVHQPLAAIGLVVLASTAGQVLAQPFWLAASRRVSPQVLYAVGVAGWCLNLLLWLAMKDRSSLWLIPLGLQAGASAGGFLMVTLGMFSTAMAEEAARTGHNREGVYSGFWLAIEKLGFAFGALIVGVVLGLFGFVESAGGAGAPQSPRAILGIALTYCGLNMAIYVASVLLVRLVPTAVTRPQGRGRG